VNFTKKFRFMEPWRAFDSRSPQIAWSAQFRPNR